MWTRVELKTKARTVLKRNYWPALLMSFILIISGAQGGGSGGGGGNHGGSAGSGLFSNCDTHQIVLICGILLMVVIFIILFRIFLGFALEVGAQRFFVRAAEGEDKMSYIGYSFSGGWYLNIVKTMFMKGLYLFLWYLCLIIPGIIKHYAYSMVPYILTEQPNMNYKQAIQLSNQMTDGHKFDIFVLELSFLGWAILGLLACLVGIFFLMPYINATKAELYLSLKQSAIEKGIYPDGSAVTVPS